MSEGAKLLLIVFTMVFTENYVLVQFVAICPFLGVSQKFDSCVGMSGAVIFVMTLASAATYLIYTYVMVPLGLRTLSRVSVVREGMADKIVDEYGNLRELMDDIEQNPSRLDDLGVKNPSILADSLYRMWGKKE